MLTIPLHPSFLDTWSLSIPSLESKALWIIIIIIIIYLLEFFTSALADGLSLEFEWQQVSSSLQSESHLLSILAILNNAVVWMVSTHPPNSKSSCPFSNPFSLVLLL